MFRRSEEKAARSSASHMILPILSIFIMGVFVIVRSPAATMNYLYAMVPMLLAVALTGTYAYNHDADMRLFSAFAILASAGIALQLTLDQTFATQTVFSGLKYAISFFIALVFIGFYQVFHMILNKSFTVYLMMILSAAVYAVLIWKGFDPNGNGTSAWLRIGPYTLQLTDFTKIGAVLFYSSLFSSNTSRDERNIIWISTLFFLINLAGSVLIKELGSFFILYFLHLSILYIFMPRGKRKRIYLLVVFFLTAGAVAGSFALYKVLAPIAAEGGLSGIALRLWPIVKKVYQRFSVTANIYLDPYGSGYQLMQGRKALWMAGMFGNRVHFNAIPVAESDMAFVALITTFGFVPALYLLVQFLIVMLRGSALSRRLVGGSLQDGVVAYGFTILLFAQAMIVILGSCNVIPFAGLPIPFLSRGFTYQTIVFCFAGLLLHLSEDPDHTAEGGEDDDGQEFTERLETPYTPD